MLDITQSYDRRDGWNEDEFFSDMIRDSPKWGSRMFPEQYTAMRFSLEMKPDNAPNDEEWVRLPPAWSRGAELIPLPCGTCRCSSRWACTLGAIGSLACSTDGETCGG